MDDDIRWKQRFTDFKKAFLRLKQAVDTYDDSAEDIINEGIIQRFEFTHEFEAVHSLCTRQ
mgnify:CR=1 FL=1